MPHPYSATPFAGLLVLSLALPLAGQEESCTNGRVGEIVVENGPVIDQEDIPGGFIGWGLRLANRVHVRTDADLIRKELLVQEGDCFDPFLIEDSERILRRYGFLSEVEVFAIRVDAESWRVRVTTSDEWSTRVELTAEFDNGLQFREAALAETNVLGQGMTLRAFFQQDEAERQIGGSFWTPRLFGTRMNLGLQGGSTRVGDFHAVDLKYPFIGEVGRYAGRILWSEMEDFFPYSRGSAPDPDHVLLPVREGRFTATIARRFGEPGNLAIAGVGLSRETLDFPGFPDAVESVSGESFSSMEPADPSVADSLRQQTAFGSGTRLNILLGQRNIRFVQRTGLDALRGLQDVEVGTDVSLTLGRTISGVGGGVSEDDLLVRVRFYGATAPAPWTLISSLSIEGRQLFFDAARERTGWRDVLAELDLLLYWQPPRFSSHTLLGKVSAAGGWEVDVPYQLTLGGPSRVRGYGDSAFQGGRRVIFSLEDRIYFGWPFPETLDFGATIFTDVGHMWSGDVPFGDDSGWVGTIGAGLRFGFPSGTRGVIRADLARPVGPGASENGWSFRISAVDLIGLTGGLLDPQLERSRLSRTGADRFTPTR